jgi:hypothetical protein
MMLQAIAAATVFVQQHTFEDLTKGFILAVLDELALAGCSCGLGEPSNLRDKRSDEVGFLQQRRTAVGSLHCLDATFPLEGAVHERPCSC